MRFFAHSLQKIIILLLKSTVVIPSLSNWYNPIATVHIAKVEKVVFIAFATIATGSCL